MRLKRSTARWIGENSSVLRDGSKSGLVLFGDSVGGVGPSGIALPPGWHGRQVVTSLGGIRLKTRRVWTVNPRADGVIQGYHREAGGVHDVHGRMGVTTIGGGPGPVLKLARGRSLRVHARRHEGDVIEDGIPTAVDEVPELALSLGESKCKGLELRG